MYNVERKMYETIEDLSGVEIIAANFLIIEYGKIVDGLNNNDENQIKFLQRHREKFMTQAHQSHGDIRACLRKIRELVYRPQITTHLKQKIKDYEICKKYQENKVIKDPLMSHETNTKPSSKIGVNIYLDDRIQLVTSNYYSNNITVRRLCREPEKLGYN